MVYLQSPFQLHELSKGTALPRSRYDELHDRFDPIKTGKAGTRYERLAAMVLKALHERDVVVHDIKLRGDSTVPHQIDVCIDRDGQNHRVIVECKDFDTRGAKVDLEIVRSFRSVIEDTDAAEAIIVTCNGFTEPAMTYAKAKGIRLAILRTFEPEDMQGRLQTIVVNMNIRGIVRLEVEQLYLDQQNHDLLESQLAAAGLGRGITPDTPIAFVKEGESIQFNTFLHRQAMEHAGDADHAEGKFRILPDGWQLSIADGQPITFEAINLSYLMASDTETFEITSDRIAELILADLDGSDQIIYADQLTRYQVGPNGAVG